VFNIVPSIWDVFNFTTVEAMSSGRPTIVSRGVGASELIDDQESGYLFTSNSAESLAAVLDRVLSQSSTRLAAIGKAAQEKIGIVLEPNKAAAQRIAAYRATIKNFRAKPQSPVQGSIGDICRPTAPRTGSGTAFLDHHPLRTIASYLLSRGHQKVASRMSQIFFR
jgi:hypothetical protein